MITLTTEDLRLLIYPDGQPHVRLDVAGLGDSVRLMLPIRTPQELFVALAARNALRHTKQVELCVRYLMGGRSDREQVAGHSVDLEVVAQMLNTCEFSRVVIFDPHSPNTQRLIRRSVAVEPQYLVSKYSGPAAVLIVPDTGALRRLPITASWNRSFSEYVTCDKHRNPLTGKIELTVNNPDWCESRECVIVDDICDGGGTFLQIAEQIHPSKLTLIVSHAIFSKGLNPFVGKIDHIITSDSWKDWGNTSLLTTYPLGDNWYEM